MDPPEAQKKKKRERERPVLYLKVTSGTCLDSWGTELCRTWRVRVFRPESGLGSDCSRLRAMIAISAPLRTRLL